MNVFRWMQDNYVLEYNEGNKNTTGLYDYGNDRLMKSNLKDVLAPKRDSMERKVKAFIQQYHNRLLEDRMLPGESKSHIKIKSLLKEAFLLNTQLIKQC